MPMTSASSVALTETKMLVRSARKPSGVLSSVRKLSSVGCEVEERDADAGDGEGVGRVAQRGRDRPVEREDEDQRGDDREDPAQAVDQRVAQAGAARSHA